ncbi:hypothetical protein EIP91_000108 [Steccherinum ochraceum]|uniref:Uncharacterized protein n=1 Tax=Steccherinum ochraceum TaxID=92696 RepID=A0A4R0RV34_9APHY|nr:hypothetical protein EIP91_000108 [Steccherinum ochraceum]
MTEYTTSSEAIRDYMSSRERTALWVQEHGGFEDDFLLSPSVPPSVLEDPDAPRYSPSESDCESSHSTPPRMVLRWDDGRPDVPIPHEKPGSRSFPRSRAGRGSTSHPPIPEQMRSQPRAIPSAGSHRSRHAQTLSYVTSPTMEGGPAQGPISRSPESIVVLPSRESEQSSQTSPHGPIPPPPSHRTHSRAPTHQSSRSHPPTLASPTPRLPHNPSHGTHPPRSAHSPPVMYSQSQPLPMSTTGGERYLEQQAASQSRGASQLPYNYSPPAIIYAPSSKHSSSRYAPPAIVYSPPSHPRQMDGRYPPPSVAYSQSAPISPNVPYPDPSLAARTASRHRSHTTSVIPEEPSEHSHHGRGRSPSRGRSRGPSGHGGSDESRGRSRRGRGIFGRPSSPSRSPSRTPSLGRSDAGSVSSAGTYYILPTPGQKVQIIVPNGRSTYTATTTTAHSPHSPQSYTSSRKPFFQRIFAIPRFSTPSVDSRGSASSRGSRKLQRRHTIGGAHLRHQHDTPK